jgi:hypothetical protein
VRANLPQTDIINIFVDFEDYGFQLKKIRDRGEAGPAGI